MNYIPYEIVNHILYFVPDKIYASMTCKLFQKMLHNMYETKQITNYNDPYVLSKHCKGIEVCDVGINCLSKILNHKSLDYFVYRYDKNNIFFSENLLLHFTIQHCISGHISTPNNILKLVGKLDKHDYVFLSYFIDIYKAYESLPIIMTVPGMKESWILCMCSLHNPNISIDDVVAKFDVIIEMGIMDYEFIVNKLENWKDYREINRKHELIECLKKKLKL